MPQPFAYRVKRIKEELDLTNMPIMPSKIPIIPPWKLPVIEYCQYFSNTKKNISDEIIRQVFLSHASQHRNAVPVFTDGSKSDAGVGFGVILPHVERSGKLPNSASIFTAELHGILRALKEILSYNEDVFIIYSDSKSVLQSLQIFNPLHPLILEILEWILLARRRGKTVEFCWVPAHVGVRGNERADEVAKSAASRPETRRISLPLRDEFPTIRKSIKTLWQRKWENITTNKKMREITPSVTPWKYPIMPRRWEMALCRLRIGHTRLTHGFLMASEHQPFCDDCLVPLTVRHLLAECPSLGDIRRQFLMHARGRDGEYLLSKILGEEANLENIFSFVEEAGLIHQF